MKKKTKTFYFSQFSLDLSAEMKAVLILIIFYSMTSDSTTIEKEWENFKLKFKKSYESSEDSRRFNIFRDNFEFIQKHNENVSATYKLEVNRRTDLTAAENIGISGKSKIS